MAKAHFMKPNLTFEMIQEIVQKYASVSAENFVFGRSLLANKIVITLKNLKNIFHNLMKKIRAKHQIIKIGRFIFLKFRHKLCYYDNTEDYV